MTKYQQFVARWRNCTACRLCETRRNVVLARGSIPCDVLFVGEAPGESEDVLRVPFVGPAGKLLDQIVLRAIIQTFSLRTCFCNLVCCIPRDGEGNKAGEPDDAEIQACSVRLIEFVELADPRLVVCVGKLAQDFLEPGWKHSIQLHKDIPRVSIVHPAAILRANIAQQGLLVQRCVVTVANAVEAIGDG